MNFKFEINLLFFVIIHVKISCYIVYQNRKIIKFNFLFCFKYSDLKYQTVMF